MSRTVDHDNDHKHQQPRARRTCSVCGAIATGINFGAPTCAPCKAFFRRNARRKDFRQAPCHPIYESLSNGKYFDINDITNHYLQIRRCTSCRLRRCFDMGMKAELIRTDEDNLKRKKIVKTKRNSKELSKSQEPGRQLSFPQNYVNSSELAGQIDWYHLSNIVSAYDTYCLKTYINQRTTEFIDISSEEESTMNCYFVITTNMLLSLSSFIRSLPSFQSLWRTTQYFLCVNNLRQLLILNNHELNQSCFSDPWQTHLQKSSWEFLCGSELYKQYVYTKQLAEKLLITDPNVTRLWLVILFFSPPLFSYYDPESFLKTMNQKLPSIDIQNAYATLLWKYLLHRHGFTEAIRIYSNLLHVFLHMLQVGIDINIRLRTDNQLITEHTTLEQLSTLEITNTK